MSINTENLSIELADLLGSPVGIEPLESHEIDGMAVTVCDFDYSVPGSGDTPDNHYRQTGVVLDCEDLDLPKFSLAPKPKGVLKLLRSMVGGFGAIEFEDTPEFSKLYDVHGWSEKPVRVLFIREIRDHLAKKPGWSVRGQGTRLVIFQRNRVCKDQERETFVGNSLEIMQLFRDGEEALDAQPAIRRETDASDILATTDRMGGFVGASLRRQLEKFMTTPADFEMFVNSPVPRRIPSSIKRQVMGDNFPLIPIGMMFAIVGLVAGVSIMIFDDSQLRFPIGMAFACLFPVVGGLMAGLTFMHRREKGRLLKKGVMTTGVISKVKKSGAITHQQAVHKVKLKYEKDGEMIAADSTASGIAATQAEQLLDSKKPVRVLVDPANPEHVFCLDLLVINQ